VRNRRSLETIKKNSDSYPNYRKRRAGLVVKEYKKKKAAFAAKRKGQSLHAGQERRESTILSKGKGETAFRSYGGKELSASSR